MYCVRCGFEVVQGDDTEQGVMLNGEMGRAHHLSKCFDLVNQDRKLYREKKDAKVVKEFYAAHPDGASPRPEPPAQPKAARPIPMAGQRFVMEVVGEDKSPAPTAPDAEKAAVRAAAEKKQADEKAAAERAAQAQRQRESQQQNQST